MPAATAALAAIFATRADLVAEVDRQVADYDTHEATAFENIADQYELDVDDVEDAYYAAKLSGDSSWYV